MSLVMSRKSREVAAVSGNKPKVTKETDPDLFCRADGCYLRWAVQTSDVTACSYHAWAETKDWPRITDDLHRLGPWKLKSTSRDTHTVADMKSRLKGRIGNVA